MYSDNSEEEEGRQGRGPWRPLSRRRRIPQLSPRAPLPSLRPRGEPPPPRAVGAPREAERQPAATTALARQQPEGFRHRRPGAHPAVGERAVPGHADQNPVRGARLQQDPAQQPRAQHAPSQEPPPAGWQSKSNSKKRFENCTENLLLSN